MFKYIRSISQISNGDYYTAIQKKQSLVYYAFINEFDITGYSDILSDIEMKKVEGFFTSDDKMRSIVGSMIIRQILALLIQVKPCSVQILAGKFGKPYCTDSICHFNISHSNNCVVVALNSMYVGVDVEFICPGINWNEIAELIFSEKECQGLLQENNVKKYLMTWVYKEALGKLIGCGLNQQLLRQFYIENINWGLNILKHKAFQFNININIVEIADNYILALITADEQWWRGFL